VGHSWGGAAIVLAEEDSPGTFAAIYGYEAIIPPPGVSAPGGADNPLAASARRRREVFASKDEAYENYGSKPPFDILHPAALRAYVDHGFEELPAEEGGGVRLKCRREDEARVYEHAARHHAFEGLARVACPVVFAAGERTTTFPVGFYEKHVRAVPHGRTEELPGLGHFGPLEDPAAVAASIRRAFLAG
jgi:pimeloyl-ACP methyl ester carboxylesterase